VSDKKRIEDEAVSSMVLLVDHIRPVNRLILITCLSRYPRASSSFVVASSLLFSLAITVKCYFPLD
jgi:hypothetical protein